MKKIFSLSFIFGVCFSLLDSLYILNFDKKYIFEYQFLSVILFLFVLWQLFWFVVFSFFYLINKSILKKRLSIDWLFFHQVVQNTFKSAVFIYLIFLSLLVFRVITLYFFGFKGLRVKKTDFKKLDKPNVILITIDTLRADALPAYGNDKIKTPALDLITNKSYIFDYAFSQADWTFPSLGALMTGKYPTELDISVDKRTIPEINDKDRISSKLTTLAEILKKQGYYTQAILTNPWLSGEHHGFSQGFNGYYNFDSSKIFFYRERGKKSLILKIYKRFIPKTNNYLPKIYQFITESFGKAYEIRAESVLKTTIPWVNKIKDKTSFFLWMHLFDPHAPYDPPEKYLSEVNKDINYLRYLARDGTVRDSRVRFSPEDKKLLKDLYLKEIEYLDSQLDVFIKYLKKEKLFNDSLIIITSDHGEAFWERDFQGHGKNFYNEEIRVPLFIKLPNQDKKVNVLYPVGLIDVYSFSNNYISLSKNKTNDFNPETIFKKREFFISEANHTGTDKKAIIKGKYKFILDMNTGEKELYNYVLNNGERENLIFKEKGKAFQLENKLLNSIFSIKGSEKQIKRKGSERLDFGY